MSASDAVAAYAAAIVDACAPPAGPLVSLVVFGSASSGGYSPAVSDVDLLLIVDDRTDAAAVRDAVDIVTALEHGHGLNRRPQPLPGRMRAAVDAFTARLTANNRSFFVCRRADLLSGEPARILGISRAQAFFVDRVAVPSIVASGRTVWGEDLLAQVPLQRITRLDVAKAWFSLSSQSLLAAGVFPILPHATKYAMDALKRSVHNCYFCRHGRVASVEAEVDFFHGEYGRHRMLERLLELRLHYVPSFRFVIGCVPTITRLHARTARDGHFPLDPARHMKEHVNAP